MKPARWQSCNVLQASGASQRLWQFNAGDGKPSLESEHPVAGAGPVPPGLAVKDWRQLFHRRCNVALLPASHFFLRVIHLPSAGEDELISMVELQLEKLSPLPVAQIVWSFDTLPKTADELTPVIVIIAERSSVETYLGQLETRGYLADRLELPLLRQLQVVGFKGDGTWIHIGGDETGSLALVAWHYGETLRHINLLHIPDGPSSAEALTRELLQTAWAGEVEGWLTGSPRWILVGPKAVSAQWQNELTRWAGRSVETLDAPDALKLASQIAGHAFTASPRINLVPADYLARCRQKFIDGLWMRSVGAILGVYVIGVLIYLGALQVLKYQESAVEKQIAAISGSYTNALQAKARIQVLQDQTNLRFAALDCLKAASDLLPEELTLTSITFQRGHILTLYGVAGENQAIKVTDYNESLKKHMVNGAPLFSDISTPRIDTRPGASGPQTPYWSFACELRRADAE